MLLLATVAEAPERPMLLGQPFASSTHFHCAYGFATRRLALALDSLVRVSRRVGRSRFGSITLSRLRASPKLFAGRQPMLPFAWVSGRRRTGSGFNVPPPVPSGPLSAQLASSYRFLLNGFKSFNPLFKVLFIFPSQYLCAIGFPSVFSLGRSLSPD